MSSLINSKNLTAYDGGGAASEPDATGFVTLDIDDHYFEIPDANDGGISIHIQTDGTIAGTFTIEGANFPAKRGEHIGPADLTAYNETSGGVWVQVNVAAAGYAQGVGTGWTITVLSLAKTAGAGSAVINLFDCDLRRLRLKAAITTGGTCRVAAHGKD